MGGPQPPQHGAQKPRKTVLAEAFAYRKLDLLGCQELIQLLDDDLHEAIREDDAVAICAVGLVRRSLYHLKGELEREERLQRSRLPVPPS